MKKLLNKLQFKHKRGYTLLEILVIVIILVVLANIAGPVYRKVIRRSHVSDGLNALDMLAGAQDKYFIEHGMYARSLDDLKAPIKEHKSDGSQRDIHTANFNYNQDQDRHCITASSNVDNYTLVRNYRSKEKVFCIGEGCGYISDYVSEVGAERYKDLCPLDNNWGSNANEDNHAGNSGSSSNGGNDNGNDGNIDRGSGQGTNTGNDGDNGTNSEKDNDRGDNGGGRGNDRGTSCQHPCNPSAFNSTTWTNNEACSDFSQRGSDNGNSGHGEEGCGVYKYNTVCERNSQGEWCENTRKNCVPKDCEDLMGAGFHLAGNDYSGFNKCACVKDCREDTCSVLSCKKQICDAGVNLSQGGRGKSQALTEATCGIQNITIRKGECNFSTGSWECVTEADECVAVRPEGLGETCDGKHEHPDAVEGNSCGVKKVDLCEINDSCSGVDTTLKCEVNTSAGYKCFSGETSTTGCPEGQHKVCNDCKWSSCQYMECDCSGLSQLEEMYVPGTQECKKYAQACVRNEETKQCEWQYKMDAEIWAQPGYDCITGSNPIPCEGDDRVSGGNNGGNGGDGGTNINISGSFTGHLFCNNCRYSACTNCDPANKPEPHIRNCFTSDGKCGKIMTDSYCDESAGYWTVIDDPNMECDGIYGPKPTEPLSPILVGGGCFKQNQDWKCKLNGWVVTPTGPYYTDGDTGVWVEGGGLLGQNAQFHVNNCTNDNKDIHGNPLPNGMWCENCIQHRCPEGAVHNINYGNKCWKSFKDDYVLALNNSMLTLTKGEICVTSYPADFLACATGFEGVHIGPAPDHCVIGNAWQCQSTSSPYYGPREVIQVSSTDLIDYCKNALHPSKLATDFVYTENIRYSGVNFCIDHGMQLYRYCDPYIIADANFDVCSELPPEIIYSD